MRAREGDLASFRLLVREALATEMGPGEHPSDYDVASYLEGGLDTAAEERFERHVALCPECAVDLVLARRTADAAEAEMHGSRWKMAVGFAVLALAVVGALLAGRMVGSGLESGVVARLQGAVGGKVSVQGAELRLAGGPGLRLSGLSVADPAGGEPLLTAPEASFTVDVATALGGELAGTLRLDHPVLNVVRDASDRLNFDAVLPKAVGRNAFDLGTGAAVSSIQVNDGTVRVIDRADGTPHEIHLAAVNGSLSGLTSGLPARIEARAGIESALPNLTLSGSVGPWGGAAAPSYVFDRIALQGVPMKAWPRLGEVVRGGLSFDGRLASAGETWSEISRRLTGSGDLSLVAGSVVGRNLVATVMEGFVPGPEHRSRLELLAAAETRFEQLSSPIEVAALRMVADDLRVRGAGYEVVGRGSIGVDGALSFEGNLAIAAELSRELVAAAPAGSRLLNERGEISLPFRLAGTWPEIRASVDLEQVVQRVLLRDALAGASRTLLDLFG